VSEDSVTITIPKKLFKEIQKKVRESEGEFKDVQQYVIFVLNEIVKEESKTLYTNRDEEEIKKRLKDLGYL